MVSKENVYYVATGILADTFCFLLVLTQIGNSYIDGAFHPSGVDPFYHSRRILDAVNNLAVFYQFDPKIHAPEGSYLTWPWGFDFSLALIVKGLLFFIPEKKPIDLLVFIPAFCGVRQCLSIYRIGKSAELKGGIFVTGDCLLRAITADSSFALHRRSRFSFLGAQFRSRGIPSRCQTF